MVKKYRKRAIVIEAMYWSGGNINEIENFCQDAMTWDHGQPIIHTIDGDMTIGKGTYVIKGIEGEIYPCKASIFESTYDEVAALELEEK